MRNFNQEKLMQYMTSAVSDFFENWTPGAVPEPVCDNVVGCTELEASYNNVVAHARLDADDDIGINAFGYVWMLSVYYADEDEPFFTDTVYAAD